MTNRPLAVWIVVAMTTTVALYQFPTYRIPTVYAPLYFLGCGALIYGFYAGARWAFVVNAITVWIFPFETYLGVKAPLHGTTLSVLHVIALALLIQSRDFFWKKPPAAT